MTPEHRSLATDASLVALALIWGVNFSVVKVVLEELDPLALNALRFPLAAVALGLVSLRSPGPPLPRREDAWRLLFLGVVGNVAYQLCFIFGIDFTRAGNASLLLATTPIWTVAFSALARHERASPLVLVGIAGTLVGIGLVVVGGGEGVSLGSRTVRGDVLMVVASVLWSVYTVGGRRPVSTYGALRVTTWTLWIGTPFLVLLGLPSLARTDFGSVSAGAWIGVVYAGLLSIGVAYLVWYRAVRRIGNNRTAVYSNLVPVAALLTAWIWLGEVPAPLELVGAAVILVGLTVARLAQSPGPSSTGRPVTASSSAR